ncbi:phosphodiester glycosidase family protein [Sphingobacterium sp. MYb382]|uniref:phosphodiester glycosidase family protein n=1 Tax=Sphingobacterium sp. MYb382 TaxID=2745278 RepID=UPI0030A42E47
MNKINKQRLFRLSAAFCTILALFSCKQRDDYPVFEEPKVVEVEKDTIPPDNNIEAITKKIMDGTDVIKTFKLDSTTVLSSGINRTHVRFQNRLGQSMSMQLLEVDLTTPNVTIQALSPFDDYLYTTQTVSDMAKYNEDRSGGQIIAAINGDAATSGAPTGSFIKTGRQIKTSTTTATTNVRPFIAVKNDGTILIGNRPSTTVPLDAYNLNDFKHLVSGVSWLLYKGDVVNSTVTTVQANTAIGLTAGKKLYALVVDGGNNAFSVGITYNDMGKIMKALGCTHAFSTNVGTSSVMVQREQTNDRLEPLIWRVVNKPTTATGVGSVNGIGIVVKK